MECSVADIGEICINITFLLSEPYVLKAFLPGLGSSETFVRISDEKAVARRMGIEENCVGNRQLDNRAAQVC